MAQDQRKLSPEKEAQAKAESLQAEAMAAKAKYAVSNKGLGERVASLEDQAKKLNAHIGI